MKTLLLAFLTGLLTVFYFSEYAGQYQPFIEALWVTTLSVWLAFGCIEAYKKIKTKY